MEYQIIPLPKEEWQGTHVPIRYTTEEYYDLETTVGNDSCCYTNIDVERHEIRFDFGYFLHKNSGRW